MHLQTSIRGEPLLSEMKSFITCDKFCSDVPEAVSKLHTFYTILTSFQTMMIAQKPSDPESRQAVPIQDQ